jgi:hypothetical protein
MLREICGLQNTDEVGGQLHEICRLSVLSGEWNSNLRWAGHVVRFGDARNEKKLWWENLLEDNIKRDLRKLDFQDLRYIKLAQGRA